MVATLTAVAWWWWLLAGLCLGALSAFFAMLSLSAGTAYGSNYHSLSPAQRVMARTLAVGSLLLATLCGLLGVALTVWSVRLWLT